MRHFARRESGRASHTVQWIWTLERSDGVQIQDTYYKFRRAEIFLVGLFRRPKCRATYMLNLTEAFTLKYAREDKVVIV
jgi:hypothetical protein